MQSVIEKTLKSGKKVEFGPLSAKMEYMAAKVVGDEGDNFAGQLLFLNECIKMTLKSIDGKPIDYASLDLDQEFSMKEIRELRRIFNQINLDNDPLEGQVVKAEG